MANIDLGKILIPAIGGIAVVTAGVLLADYVQKQGWITMRARSMPGIIHDAKPSYGRFSSRFHNGIPSFGPQHSYPAYGPYSARFDEGIPGFGPAYAFSADPFYKVGRNSQSQYESGQTFRSEPALSNIDRNYNRIFTDRF